MRLFLLRHGKASHDAPTDAERPLTDRGKKDVAKVITAVRQRLGDVDGVISSPLRRARQTAAIACKTLPYAGELLITEHLQPDGDQRALGQFLQALDLEAPILVSHQPFLGDLAAWLTDSPELAGSLSTSSLTAIDVLGFAQGGGTLLWQEFAH